jgi:hypothetical protein
VLPPTIKADGESPTHSAEVTTTTTTLLVACDATVALPTASVHTQTKHAGSEQNNDPHTHHIHYILSLLLPAASCVPSVQDRERRSHDFYADAFGNATSNGTDPNPSYCEVTLNNIIVFTLFGALGLFFATWALDALLWLGSYGICYTAPKRHALGSWYYVLTLGFLDALTPASKLYGPLKSPLLMGCALGAMMGSVFGIFASEPKVSQAILVSVAYFPLLAAHIMRVPFWGYLSGAAFGLTLSALYAVNAFSCHQYLYAPAGVCLLLVGLSSVSSLIAWLVQPAQARVGSAFKIASPNAAWRMRELRRFNRDVYVAKLFSLTKSRCPELAPPPNVSRAVQSQNWVPTTTASTQLAQPAASLSSPLSKPGFSTSLRAALAGSEGLPLPARLTGAVIASIAALLTLIAFVASLTAQIRGLVEHFINCCPSGPCDANADTLLRCSSFQLYVALTHYGLLGSLCLASLILGTDLVLSLGRFRRALLHGFQTGKLPLECKPTPVKAVLGTVRFAGLQVGDVYCRYLAFCFLCKKKE